MAQPVGVEKEENEGIKGNARESTVVVPQSDDLDLENDAKEALPPLERDDDDDADTEGVDGQKGDSDKKEVGFSDRVSLSRKRSKEEAQHEDDGGSPAPKRPKCIPIPSTASQDIQCL